MDQNKIKSHGDEQMLVNAREKALLLLIRRIGNGTLETISVKDGLPDVVVTSVQRINFSNYEHISRIFEVDGQLFPLKSEK